MHRIAILLILLLCGCATQAPSAVLVSESMAAPELGITVDEKMTVIDLTDGAAKTDGVRLGDIILSIAPADGVQAAIVFAAENREQIKQIIGSERVKIVVLRDGAEVILTVTPTHRPVTTDNPATPTPVLPPFDYF